MVYICTCAGTHCADTYCQTHLYIYLYGMRGRVKGGVKGGYPYIG